MWYTYGFIYIYFEGLQDEEKERERKNLVIDFGGTKITGFNG